MNNKMAVNTYLSTPESKNTTDKNKKQTRRPETEIMDTESVLMAARWEGAVEEWVKRLRSPNR